MLLSSADPGLKRDTVGIAGLLLNAGNPSRGLERGPGNSKRSCILVPAIGAGPSLQHSLSLLLAGTFASGLSKWPGLLCNMLSQVSRGSIPRNKEKQMRGILPFPP